jgi:hypothetical protein
MHDGALHHCTHAAAGAGRIRWRAASLMARRTNCAIAAAGAGCISWRAASLMARRIAPLRACSSGAGLQMARRTIARLQQRALAALSGAPHR